MSDPSSWDIEEDSPVAATRRSRCGRPTSHTPREATNAHAERQHPRGQRVLAVAAVHGRSTSSSRCEQEAAARSAGPGAPRRRPRSASSAAGRRQSTGGRPDPRASDSTKSAPSPRPAITIPHLPGTSLTVSPQCRHRNCQTAMRTLVRNNYLHVQKPRCGLNAQPLSYSCRHHDCRRKGAVHGQASGHPGDDAPSVLLQDQPAPARRGAAVRGRVGPQGQGLTARR